MSSPTGPSSGLPVRTPRPRQSGRHRRPEPAAAPVGAPPLVLAVPGAPEAAARGVAEEILSITRSELPGLDARLAFAAADGEEFPQLEAVLKQAAEERGDRVRRAEEAARAAREELLVVAEAEGVDPAEVPLDDSGVRAAAQGPAAVVVPLLAGPESGLLRRIREAVVSSGSAAEITDVLGPHPLLAEALHVRLSEAGLARADRARLFTVATAADGIILATVGGPEAVQAAGITGMLLSARLAVPVMAAALDEQGSVVRVAEQLRGSGSGQLALAPYLIGPEVAGGVPAEAAREAGCATAEPLGAYPAVGKLVLSMYAAALGITLRSGAQGAPLR
ncbi:sirohydrochlorin chelatase [Streptomyces sp. P1-3]|uniref:sirohydrochlorin chelatase n=1 Tax=Streptomyces sp. P1-3 TaxID=3421658 RepID=UPI003D35D870